MHRVVTGLLVRGIDGEARVRRSGAVDRPPLGEADQLVNAVLRQLGDARNGIIDQQRPFLDDDRQNEAATDGALLHADVVKLTRAEQVVDRLLHVAIVRCRVEHEPRHQRDLVGVVPGAPLDDDAVERRGGALRDRVRHARGAQCHHAGSHRAHQPPSRRRAASPHRRQAPVPVNARNTSLSLSGPTSTSISSPAVKSPLRIRSLSGSST